MRPLLRSSASNRLRQATERWNGEDPQHFFNRGSMDASFSPDQDGGLGVRRVSSLALSAFLASAAGTLSIQSLILGPTWNGEDASFDCAQADWLRITGIEDPATCPRSQAVTVGQAASAQGSVVFQRETTRPLRSGTP